MPKIPPQSVRLPIFGTAKTPAKYISRSTRYASLDGFTGGAQGEQGYPGGISLSPCHGAEDLEDKFQSGANRTDLPSAYGPASVDRKLGKKRMSLADEILAWSRRGGEILFRKG